MQTWIHEIIRVAIVGFVYVLLLVVAEIWKRRFNGAPETTRKFVHLSGGLICLSFPFLFLSMWTVFALALGLYALIVVGRNFKFLGSLHGVSRRTRGSEYYPFSIFFLFAITGPQKWLYVCSVLVLAVADAFAALIGTRYGRVKYEVEDEFKSLEGSLAFWVIAFLAIFCPMQLMTDLPLVTCILAAMLVSLLVTGFEAISLEGTDNLFVPIAVAVVLSKITTKPVQEIMHQDISLVTICLFVGLLVWRSRSFNTGGAITVILFAYGAWSLGSALWALPVLSGVLAYGLIWRLMPAKDGARSDTKVRVTFRAVSFPLVVLLTANMFKLEAFLYAPFVLMITAVLAFSLWNHVLWTGRATEKSRLYGPALSAAISAFMVALVPCYAGGGKILQGMLATVSITVVLNLVNDWLMGASPAFENDENIWSSGKLVLTIAAGAVVIVLQLTGLMPVWNPQ